MATWLKRLAAVLLVAGIIVGVNGSPAMALGPGGCGANCNGKDPNTYLVDWGQYGLELCNKQTIQKLEVANSGHYVELRYSPYCRTAWAKHSWDSGWGGYAVVWVESYSSSTASPGTFLRAYSDMTSCSSPGCAYPTQVGTYIGHTQGPWSFMVNDAGLYARACIRHWWNQEQAGPYTTACTVLY
jgi:hypothetical protein